MQNQWVQEQRAERAGARSQIMPYATGLAESEGYSDAERADILGGALESGESAFDAAGQELGNRTARTRNTAGAAANIRELARDRARFKSDTTRGTTQMFADEKQRRRLAGTQLMANLYGVDTNLLGNIAGLPIGALNAHAQGIGRWSAPFGIGSG